MPRFQWGKRLGSFSTHFSHKYGNGLLRYCGTVTTYSPEPKLLPKHRFKTWEEQRRTRLTASTFNCALGFRRGSRVALWKEKVGLAEPFRGVPATWWNNSHEESAQSQYTLITGNDVEHTGFCVHDDWLGASPDGVVDGGGVLEIKCPYRGKAREGICPPVPWERIPVCYMPQAQGLMEILDREWMDFFVWTPRGSSLFRIERDPAYWELVVAALRDFWWKHVVPTKKIRESQEGGEAEIVGQFMPSPRHERFDEIWKRSEALVNDARLLVKELYEDQKSSKSSIDVEG